MMFTNLVCGESVTRTRISGSTTLTNQAEECQILDGRARDQRKFEMGPTLSYQST